MKLIKDQRDYVLRSIDRLVRYQHEDTCYYLSDKIMELYDRYNAILDSEEANRIFWNTKDYTFERMSVLRRSLRSKSNLCLEIFAMIRNLANINPYEL